MDWAWLDICHSNCSYFKILFWSVRGWLGLYNCSITRVFCYHMYQLPYGSESVENHFLVPNLRGTAVRVRDVYKPWLRVECIHKHSRCLATVNTSCSQLVNTIAMAKDDIFESTQQSHCVGLKNDAGPMGAVPYFEPRQGGGRIFVTSLH